MFGSPPEPKPARTPDVEPARPVAAGPPAPEPQPEPEAPPARPAAPVRKSAAKVQPKVGGTSRPRHEEKVTFYCTDSDLTRLEAARLDLRANHRLVSDRGRIVRAALAEVLDDFDARGADSLLVKRLSSE